MDGKRPGFEDVAGSKRMSLPGRGLQDRQTQSGRAAARTKCHQAIRRAAAVLGRYRPGSEGNLASDNENTPTKRHTASGAKLLRRRPHLPPGKRQPKRRTTRPGRIATQEETIARIAIKRSGTMARKPILRPLRHRKQLLRCLRRRNLLRRQPRALLWLPPAWWRLRCRWGNRPAIIRMPSGSFTPVNSAASNSNRASAGADSRPC